GHFVHYYTSLWTNGYKKQAVSPLFGVGYASGFLNGFTPEYVGVLLFHVLVKNVSVFCNRMKKCAFIDKICLLLMWKKCEFSGAD
ncbi:MAG: hypothetical protein WCU80_04620, partial [Paludibacteraceae bacterium]